MTKVRIIVVVHKGMVSDVYCNTDAAVEIIDLDAPSTVEARENEQALRGVERDRTLQQVYRG